MAPIDVKPLAYASSLSLALLAYGPKNCSCFTQINCPAGLEGDTIKSCEGPETTGTVAPRQSFTTSGNSWSSDMPYLSGVLTGILLTVLVVFLIDKLGPEPDTRDIVNWDYVGTTLGASVEKVGEEVRQEVHEATAPDKDASPPPAATAIQ